VAYRRVYHAQTRERRPPSALVEIIIIVEKTKQTDFQICLSGEIWYASLFQLN
jgi:hypothetical protein